MLEPMHTDSFSVYITPDVEVGKWENLLFNFSKSLDVCEVFLDSI